MKLPAILSAATIQALAATDTHAVRIILMSSAGPTNFTLRGNGRRRGKYILVRDGVLGRHILDVPVSVWNEGMPSGRYQDNLSISHDLMSKPNLLTPFVTMIVPWKAAAEAPSVPSASATVSQKSYYLPPLQDLLVKTNAPRFMQHAMSLAAAGELEALKAFVDSISEDPNVVLPRFPGDGFDEDSVMAPEGSGFNVMPENLEPTKTDTAAAKRMRLMRERKKALKADKLQTANA